jgi:hypothetical protein
MQGAKGWVVWDCREEVKTQLVVPMLPIGEMIPLPVVFTRVLATMVPKIA